MNLIDDLLNENALFVYKGDFNHQIVDALLSNVKRKLNTDIDNIGRRKRFYQVVVECVENINRHSGWEISNEYMSKFSSVFTLHKTDDRLLTYSSNLVTESEMKNLEVRLSHISKSSIDDLKKEYRKQLLGGKLSERGGAGVGLYDVAIKSDKDFEYKFYPIADGLYYYIMKVGIKLT